MTKKPTREEIDKMPLTEYLEYAEHYCQACASCGQIGERVSQSIEGKGYYYCEDATNCKPSNS